MAKEKFDVEKEGAVFGAIVGALHEDEDPVAAAAAVREEEEVEEQVEEELKEEGADDAGKKDEAVTPAGDDDAKKPDADAPEAGKEPPKKDPDDKAPPVEEQGKGVETLKVRVRGVDRDLTKEEAVKYAQMGLNSEELNKEFDTKVATRTDEKLGDWLGEKGIVVTGQDGKTPVVSVEGSIAWVETLIREAYPKDGAALFRNAIAKIAATPPADEELSVSEIDEELKGLDPEIDEAQIKNLKRLRSLAVRLEKYPTKDDMKAATLPLDEWKNRATKAETDAELKRGTEALDKHLDTELAKYPGYTTSAVYAEPSEKNDDGTPVAGALPMGRLQIINTARFFQQQAAAKGKTLTREQALSLSAERWAKSWQADQKAAREAWQKERDKLRNQRPSPGKAAPSPGAKGGAGSSGPSKAKPGSPEWSKEQADKLAAHREALRAK